MKKIVLALALIASLQVAGAQVKSIPAAKSAFEAAKAAAANPKKAAKVATWLKLGQACMEAYEAPQGSAWVGASKQDLQLIMGNAKPTSVEDVVLEGQSYLKEVYPNCNYYFRDNVLQMIEVTNPAIPNALDEALKAYKEAYKVDAKNSKTGDIATALKNIGQKYVEQAYNAYTFGDFAKSSQLFEKAFEATSTKPCPAVDTNAIYNTGLTAWIAKDYDRAKKFFNKCVDEFNYEGSDGDVYAKLADIYDKAGDKVAMKDILEKGFASHPQSQGILIGLINYYISNQEDPARLFDLIGQAKQNEPNNASLYYVEGNINKELGKIDEAIAAYEKCAEINPDYVTAEKIGITEIYKMGGAQAIAALAFGTATVPKVNKITGPGNIFVTLAKKAVYGHVDIDMLAGPSEILIVADDSANPVYLAADLLSQAEHDPLASAILITDSERIAKAVAAEVDVQLKELPREEIAAASLRTMGKIILANNMETVVAMANLSAPEHLEVMTKAPFQLMPLLHNCGAMFLGTDSPEPLGDYFAGPNHVLPTGGTAKFYSVLNVETFMKKTSIIAYTNKALLEAADDIIAMAEAEGLRAHANAIRKRQENNNH